jgi:hypothetical protein
MTREIVIRGLNGNNGYALYGDTTTHNALRSHLAGEEGLVGYLQGKDSDAVQISGRKNLVVHVQNVVPQDQGKLVSALKKVLHKKHSVVFD